MIRFFSHFAKFLPGFLPVSAPPVIMPAISRKFSEPADSVRAYANGCDRQVSTLARQWIVLWFVLASALLSHASVLAAESEVEWFIDAEAAAGYDDNIGRAERSRDIVSDQSLRGSIGIAYNREFFTEKAITLRGFMEAETFNKLTDLSRATVGGQFIYRWQNVLGFAEPFYQLNTSVQFNEYDVRQRDSTEFNTQFIVSKRVTDNILASTGLEYKYQDSSGIVFDQQQARWFINADYAARSGWALYGTYSLIHGDTISTSQAVFCNGLAAPDIFGLVSWAEAIEQDDAFNNEYCGSWISYRLDASSNMLVVGVNKGIGHSMAFDFSVMKIIVNGAGSNKYNRTILNASLLMRFR